MLGWVYITSRQLTHYGGLSGDLCYHAANLRLFAWDQDVGGEKESDSRIHDACSWTPNPDDNLAHRTSALEPRQRGRHVLERPLLLLLIDHDADGARGHHVGDALHRLDARAHHARAAPGAAGAAQPRRPRPERVELHGQDAGDHVPQRPGLEDEADGAVDALRGQEARARDVQLLDADAVEGGVEGVGAVAALELGAEGVVVLIVDDLLGVFFC